MEDSLPELPSIAGLDTPVPVETKAAAVRPMSPPPRPAVDSGSVQPVKTTADSLPEPAAPERTPEPIDPPASPPVLVPAAIDSAPTVLPRSPTVLLRPTGPVTEVGAVTSALDVPAQPVPEPPRSSAHRLMSLDAFRGAIMLLMASSGFGIVQMAKALPDSIWARLSPQFDHPLWASWDWHAGFSVWDMIQPSFMFMVGVSMPFSYAKRIARGEHELSLFDHALFRGIILVLLGVLLSSNAEKVTSTHWLFTNVLSQIGLGYLLLYLLYRMGTAVQFIAFAAILIGCWAWFGFTTVPADAIDLTGSKIPQTAWFSGFFAHWNPHLNPAGLFDDWFLRRFPHEPKDILNEGGYQTLNFVPSLATMILGVMIGNVMRSDRSKGGKLRILLLGGVVLIALGLVAHHFACPIVKRIWTPSWVLFSGGVVMWFLAMFYLVIEIMEVRLLAMPLVVVGMNSIFVYVMSQLTRGWFRTTIPKHLGFIEIEPGVSLFSQAYLYAPVVERCSFLAVIWILCWWLYRQRAFLRI